MSLILKSRVAFSVFFTLATVGATIITAQTPAENSSINSPASESSTINPKAIASNGLSALSFEDPVANKKHEAKRTANDGAYPQAADDDEWQFQVSPYFWLAGLHGTGGVGNRSIDVDESFSDVFGVLNFAFMGTFEARKGRFVSLTDLQYVSVSDDRATPGPFFSDVDAGFKTFVFDTEVGYRIFDDPDKGASVDLLGGIRVWHVSTDFEFGAGILPATRIEGSRNWVDGVGGVRGKAALSQKWFLTGKFDLGGGSSNFTYQLFGGAGYGINEKIALIFGYRVLDVNYNKNNFLYDMNQRGPIFGLGFKF